VTKAGICGNLRHAVCNNVTDIVTEGISLACGQPLDALLCRSAAGQITAQS